LNRSLVMVWYAGMATMTHRTTFALDDDTIRRLKKLSLRWKVSLAEVVRRAVAQAEAQAPEDKPNPVNLLRQLHDSGQSLDPETAETYLAQVYEDRKHWRGE
jgi:Ribbon-helix-helix protein, copG family